MAASEKGYYICGILLVAASKFSDENGQGRLKILLKNVLKYDVVMSLNLIKLTFEHNLKDKIININDIIPIVNKMEFS